MPISFARLGNSFAFSRLFRYSHFQFSRQMDQDIETVVRVLQPGPLGIIEHKFSAEEIRAANAAVKTAVKNWRRNANIEQRSPILKDYFN